MPFKPRFKFRGKPVFEDLLTFALDGIWVVDEEGIVRYMNPAAEALTGYSADELVGRPLSRILPADVATTHADFLRHYRSEGPQFHIMGDVREFSIVARGGEQIPIGLRAFEIAEHDGRRCFGAIMQDYRPRKQLEAERDELLARLSAQALSDELTGLPNRRAFLGELQRVHASVRRGTLLAAIAVLDIDHFKQVNDTFGHDGGDVALAAVAGALHQALRGEDFLARIGGEEFALVLRGATLAMAGRVAERMREEVERCVIDLPDGRQTQVTISIGLAPLAADCSDQASHKAADKALYKAKRSGRNRVCVAYSEASAKASA